MTPAFIAQGIIMYIFQPKDVPTLAIGTPIFLLLSAGNLIAYNFLFIPKKIRSQVKEMFFGKPFGRGGSVEYEDILTELINESKARQAAYNGYLKSDLIQLHTAAVKMENRFKKLAKLSQWFTFIYVFIISAYNILVPGFQMNIIYLEWGLGLVIITTGLVLGKRQIHWGYQKNTLKRCLEKCGEENRFHFDDDL
ncbi:hypothetical protein V4D07_33290 [Paenibacillus taichungensis]